MEKKNKRQESLISICPSALSPNLKETRGGEEEEGRSLGRGGEGEAESVGSFSLSLAAVQKSRN